MTSTSQTPAPVQRTVVQDSANRFGLLRDVRLGGVRGLYEIKSYFRAGDQVFFTFLFPVLMLAIFSAAFSSIGNIGAHPDGSGGVAPAAYYLPAMISAGILLSGVQNLGIDIAMERSDGTLKRLAGSPLSPISYFIGKLIQVLVTSIAQVVILLLVSSLVFKVELPSEWSAWQTFLWVYLLGIAASSVLGIAISQLPRSGKSASAVILPPVLILQFISGVYLPFSNLPEWLQNIASVFPLKWIAQGMRAAFLPDEFKINEVGEAWNLGWVALILVVWFLVGAVLTRVFFRWIKKS